MHKHLVLFLISSFHHFLNFYFFLSLLREKIEKMKEENGKMSFISPFS